MTVLSMGGIGSGTMLAVEVFTAGEAREGDFEGTFTAHALFFSSVGVGSFSFTKWAKLMPSCAASRATI